MKLSIYKFNKFSFEIKVLNKKLFIFAFSLFIWSCSNKSNIEIRDDLGKYYHEYQVEGSFALFNENENKFIVYNYNQFNKLFSPASTFKICNSLIGLETGVIPDKSFVIGWDSINRNPIWDQNHTLESAFKHSVVWYYQELAKRVGYERMKYWVDKVNYGNKNIAGGIEQFWLRGGLKISPKQQIDFLRQLYFNQLPFTKRNMNIVKELMLIKDASTYQVYAKSGWGMEGDQDIGWYVGYVKSKDNVYFFSNCVQIKSKYLEDENKAILFDRCRREITNLIFEQLRLK